MSPDSAGRPTGAPPSEPAAVPDLPAGAVDTLLAFSEAVAGSTRPDDLLARIVTTAIELVGLPWSGVVLRDPHTGELRLVATQGVPLATLPLVLEFSLESRLYQTLRRGELFIVEDYKEATLQTLVGRILARGIGANTMLAAPLQSDGDFLGAIYLAGPTPHHYTPLEQALIRRLARLAAQLLVHTRALSAAEHRAGALETMQALATSLDATLDLETVLRMLIGQSVDLVGASGGALILWDEDSGKLMTRMSSGTAYDYPSVAPGEGLTGTAFTTGRPQVQNSYQHFAGAIPRASEQQVTNALAVPLLRGGRPFGTITVFSRVFKPFTPEDISTLTLFASQAAVAIDNQMLYSTVLSQQRQLDSIIRAMHDALIVYDRQGTIILVNPAVEELIGLHTTVVGVSRDELMRDYERYAKYQVEPLHDWDRTFDTVVTTGVTLAAMSHVHSDRVRTVESVFAPYLDAEGAIIGVISVTRDVSVSQELERVRAELEVARRQEDFLSIAAHELRTPITAIKGYADLLNRRVAPGYTIAERDTRMLGSIVAQVSRLTELIDDLLDMGRIQAGRVEFHWEQCSIREVLRGAIDSVRPVAGARENDLQLVGEDDGLVRCDPGRLAQVFVNLLTNALKYSTAGGVTCAITRRHDRVRVAVQDHGAGISPDDLPRLFERFFRSHDVYAHQRGLGLGLYISRQIVERHDGHIWAESELDVGTTFYVELPLVGAESANAEAREAAPEAPAGS
jgi:two-component system, OmpR family, phosphate regulon sensor histidine kinase PhoR